MELLFWFIVKIIVSKFYCPVNFICRNFINFLDETVGRNNQSFFVIGLVPKGQKSNLKSCEICP